MKQHLLSISIFILAITLCSCGGNSNSSAKQTDESVAINQNVVPEIDLTKDYEKKEIFLKDYLDIEYIPLETNNNSLVYRYTPPCVSDKYIVAASKTEIKIFDNEGKFINTFEHEGKADNEYSRMSSFCVDFNKEEIFIYDYPYLGKILVYSFDGSFKRKLSSFSKYLFDEVYNYNNEYLIVRDIKNVDPPKEEDKLKINKEPYLLISKLDGTIKALPLEIENRYGDRIMTQMPKQANGKSPLRVIDMNMLSMNNLSGDIIIFEYALDTIYKYSNDTLTPFLTLKNRDGIEYMTQIISNSERYIFLSIVEKKLTGEGLRFNLSGLNKEYMIDKKSLDIYEVEIKDDINYLGSGVRHHIPASYNTVLLKDALDFIELNEEGKLTPQEQEIASKLSEEDNPVLILGKFKE